MAVTVGRYKGIEVTAPKLTIREEDVENQIEALLTQYPKRVEKEGPVAVGDTTVIDFEGFKDGVPFDGGKGTGYELGIGSHSFIPGFEEQMVGMAKGETRDLHLTFPEQYPAPDLAGAEVVFTVTVHEIFTTEKAELTDEFAASFGMPDISNAEEMKAYIRKSLNEQAEARSKDLAHSAVMDALLEVIEAEAEENEILRAVNNQLAQIRMNLMQQGASLEDYLQAQGATMDMLKEQLNEMAQKQVKLEKGLQEICRLEGIALSDEDINSHYQRMSEVYGVSVEELKKEVPEEEVTRDILLGKASELIVREAKITYTED
ncbi:MAG: trigger factor [Eubacteriales bacterium]|nr:trigger factor [Eubacteriales bacterium]